MYISVVDFNRSSFPSVKLFYLLIEDEFMFFCHLQSSWLLVKSSAVRLMMMMMMKPSHDELL